MTQRNQSGRRSSPLLTDSQESQSFCFTPAFDGLDETHAHLLSSVSCFKISSHREAPTPTHPECLTQYLGTLWSSQVDT